MMNGWNWFNISYIYHNHILYINYECKFDIKNKYIYIYIYIYILPKEIPNDATIGSIKKLK